MNQEDIVEILQSNGIDKEYVENLYRGDNFYNQRKIVAILQQQFTNIDIQQSHVKALFKKFNIDVWNVSETRHAQRINPISEQAIEARIKLLKDHGFSIEDLERLYKKGLSKNEIIEHVNSTSQKNILHKKAIKDLWEYFNLEKRTQEQDNTLRMQKINTIQKDKRSTEKMYGNGFSAHELIDLYNSGLSLNQVAEKTGSNSTTISHLVKNAGYTIRNQENYHTPEQYIEILANNGFDQQWFKNNIDKYSNLQIIKIINDSSMPIKINRMALTKILRILHVTRKTQKQDRRREPKKLYGKGITKQQAIKIYTKDGLSLQQMYDKYGISPTILSNILKNENIDVKKQINVTEILEELHNKGIKRDNFIDKYHIENFTQSEMIEWLATITEYKITPRTFQKMVKILKIEKTKDLKKSNQGKKSRAELLRNLGKLEKAGFNNREDLAKYYEDNKNLTKQSLVKELNEKIDEEFFTMRWLGRHLDPFLSEDRLKGVSRVEKEFQNFIIEMMGEDKVLLNDWSMISPYQLDVVIPEKKIAIEFNGNYWHSDKFLLENHNMTAEEYHNMKKLLCKDQGIQLAFVWEYDWYDFHDKIISQIYDFIYHDILGKDLLKLSYH